MIILLSSSSTKLYKTDVIRSLAYPEHTTIQFRYDKKWIQSDETSKGTKGVICYLDSKDYTVVPVRYCQILQFEEIDELSFYTLELLDYPTPSFLDGNKEKLKLPTKESKGKYVLDFAEDNPQASTHTQDSIWMGIVKALSQCPDMQEVEYFYKFYPLVDSRKRKVQFDTKLKIYRLKPNSCYTFKVLNYHPKTQSTGIIEIDNTAFADASSPHIEICSRYDLSFLQIRTKASYFTDKFGYYRVRCKLGKDYEVPNDFQFKINNNLLTRLFTVVLFVILGQWIESSFDDLEGYFNNIHALLTYSIFGLLIVFSGEVFDIIERTWSVIWETVKKILTWPINKLKDIFNRLFR